MNKNIISALPIKIVSLFIMAALFLFFFSKYVPFDMDEFCHYLPLSCQQHPLNKLNSFQDACNTYDLAPWPNLYLPLRSYYYEGSVQSILYYPLFLLWHSPHSARLLGLIMLALQAFLLHKLFKTDILFSFIFLLFYMPYTFGHIVDTGPITFQTTSVFLICFLSAHWVVSLRKSSKLSWLYPLGIGIILFLGIWSKLAYFAMLPPLILMILFTLIDNIKIFDSLPRLKTLLGDLLVLLTSAIIPTFLLLNSSDLNGNQYYQMFHYSKFLGILDFSKLTTLSCYFTNPLKAAHRIFKFENAPPVTLEGILLISTVVIFILGGIMWLCLKNIKTNFIIENLFFFFMTLFLLSKSSSTWAMQHVVLSLPFLVLALFYLFSKINNHKFKIIFAVFFMAINLSLYLQLPHLQYEDSDPPSKIQLNELLNEKFADKYAFVVIDWGMYHIKSLYGKKDQCVLYIYPLNNEGQITDLKRILNKLKRKALFIGRIDSESDLKFINTEFPSLTGLNTPFDTGKWQVLYEK